MLEAQKFCIKSHREMMRLPFTEVCFCYSLSVHQNRVISQVKGMLLSQRKDPELGRENCRWSENSYTHNGAFFFLPLKAGKQVEFTQQDDMGFMICM